MNNNPSSLQQDKNSAIIEYNLQNNSIILRGDWVWSKINEVQIIETLSSIRFQPKPIEIDGMLINKIDTFGIFFINKVSTLIHELVNVKPTTSLTPHHLKLFNLIVSNPNTLENFVPPLQPNNILDAKQIIRQYIKPLNYPIMFLGQTILSIIQIIKKPHSLDLKEISRTILNTGFNSIFVVLLLNFLIASTLAYEMAPQFTKYGANIFIVNFLGIAMLKEVSPLLTAIIIAGRTGSSITAEIGTMKINEEIDALRTMGISPFQKLVLPKIIGIVIATPLLTAMADFIGMLGGAIVANHSLSISYDLFIERTQTYVSINNYTAGIIKSIAFGLGIAFIGCLRGFMVQGNANSIGTQTTKSVVLSIIMIIFLDAVFAVILYNLRV